LSSVKQIWKHEGARGFYKGIVPALWGSGASWGFYFYFYEGAKRSLGRSQPLQTTDHMLAAAFAGVLTCFLTNPIWLIKTRMQLQADSHVLNPLRRPYRGMIGMFIVSVVSISMHISRI
jgi:solute carrier family 25 folate transporter 32